MEEDEAMSNSPVFGWLTVALYVALAVTRWRAGDLKTAFIAATFAVSNWAIFCWR